MKLQCAYLCVDCQHVTEGDGHGRCAVCGGQATLNLAKLLNRSDELVLDCGSQASAGAETGELVLSLAGEGIGWRN
ncbi:MAG TPA: hypothetical protein VGS20_13125 [Candidatus Acidoferrales bacterium]|nr:hypothetical protein [Candidatus Acidoferrales bacterium]